MFSAEHQRYLKSFFSYSSQYMARARVGNEKELYNQLSVDLMDFVLFLFSKDGKIHPGKREEITSAFGYSIPESQWPEYARAHELLFSSYTTRVPRSFLLLMQAEKTHAGVTTEGGSKTYVETADWLSRLFANDSSQLRFITRRRDAYLNNLCNVAAAKLTTPWKTRILDTRVAQDKQDAETFYDFEVQRHIVRKLKAAISSFARIGSGDGGGMPL